MRFFPRFSDFQKEDSRSASSPLPRGDFGGSRSTARRWTGAILALVCVAAMAVLAGCRSQPSGGQGLIPVRLQTDWYPQPEHGGFYTALVKGYYKAEGLDVTILPLSAYGSGAQVVTTGGAEFGLGANDGILEWVSNGLPVLAVAATMQHDPQAVMVHAESPVHSFADLNGHQVAAQPGATWFKFVARRFHADHMREIPATHSIAGFLADPNYIQQIFVTSEPYFAQQAGVKVRTLLISNSGYDPYRVYFTTQDYAAKHPDVVAKFVRASIQGWREYLRDPAPANALMQKLNPELNPAQMRFTVQALKDGGFIDGGDANGNQIGKMTDARWTALSDQLKQLGIVKPSVDPKTAYTLKFLPR